MRVINIPFDCSLSDYCSAALHCTEPGDQKLSPLQRAAVTEAGPGDDHYNIDSEIKFINQLDSIIYALIQIEM